MVDEPEPPELGPLRDTSLIWRLSLWGGAASVALTAAVLVTQTDLGTQRLTEAFNGKPAAELATPDVLMKRAEAQRTTDTKVLETRIRELSADRDRLNERIASLEQNFSDITGSIKRDLAAVAATAPRPVPVAAPPSPVLTAPPSTTPADAQPAPAETKSDAKSESKPADLKPSEKAVEKPAEPKPQAERQSAPAPAAAAPAAPPTTVTVRMPPVRVAAVTDPAAEDVRKAELAVDIGGARTMEILHARWAAVKANFGPLIEGLSPLVTYDNRPGVIPYRLIVGPLPNGAAAAQICTRFAASRVSCRTTRFVGEKLTQIQ